MKPKSGDSPRFRDSEPVLCFSENQKRKTHFKQLILLGKLEARSDQAPHSSKGGAKVARNCCDKSKEDIDMQKRRNRSNYHLPIEVRHIAQLLS